MVQILKTAVEDFPEVLAPASVSPFNDQGLGSALLPGTLIGEARKYPRGSQELQLPNLVIQAFLLCPASLPWVPASCQSNSSLLIRRGKQKSSPGIHFLVFCLSVCLFVLSSALFPYAQSWERKGVRGHKTLTGTCLVTGQKVTRLA